MAIERRGVLFVVSAPSGAGKTTLCKELVTVIPGVHPSISYTTRKPRPGEVHGREYYFVEEQAFQDMVQRNDFAESARVYGHFYGTPRQALTDMMDKGLDVLLEIDTQGAMQIKKKFSDGVYIYILPPSIDALRTRLVQRGDAPEEIQRRMQKARQEILSYREYDYIVRNEDLKQASQELQAIVHAERTRMKRVDINWLERNFIADPTTT
ncbi:MAG TPA: guanylate kinase [Nitrospiraceae bacterium]|nr:guanylate kinase [Nitrospiraceae bacterium]